METGIYHITIRFQDANKIKNAPITNKQNLFGKKILSKKK